MGEAYNKLRTVKHMKIKEVLYVPGLKKNLLSISFIDNKWFRVAFVYGEVIISLKGKTIDDSTVIGVEEGGIYKLKGHTDSTLIASTISPCELWHKLLAHVNYKSLPIVRKGVTCLPEIHIDHKGVCKGRPQGKNTKNPFPDSNNKEKGILYIVHSYVCGPM